LYRQALALEPNNVSAMVGLASSLSLQAVNFSSKMDEKVQEKKYAEARDLALKAKETDPDNPGVYIPIAAYAEHHGDWEGVLRADETRLSLAQKDPNAYSNVARALLYLGEPQRSMEFLTQAINLDPKHANEMTLINLCRADFMLGNNDAAIESCLKSLEKNPDIGFTYGLLAMAYALKGEDDKARAAATEFRRLEPNETVSSWRKDLASTPAVTKEWFESKVVPAARKAGLPE